MAWLTTATAANQVIRAASVRIEYSFTGNGGTGWVQQKRTVTTYTYEYTGIDATVGASVAAALYAGDSNSVSCDFQYEGAGGGSIIHVTQVYGAYTNA